jgi:hypothetical protein
MLADAGARCGGPRLRFNAEDEMREYATFSRYDHPTVWFRVAPGDSVFGSLLLACFEWGIPVSDDRR